MNVSVLFILDSDNLTFCSFVFCTNCGAAMVEITCTQVLSLSTTVRYFFFFFFLHTALYFYFTT